MDKKLPLNSAELLGRNDLDDQAFITAHVTQKTDACKILVTDTHPIMSNDESLQQACNAFGRADTGKYLSGNNFLLTGNNLTYIIMPSGKVHMWMVQRDGGGYKDFWCTPGGIVGPEGPLRTIQKELSEEVGILIRGADGKSRIVCFTGDDAYMTKQKKLEQVDVLQKSLPNETIDPNTTVQIEPRRLNLPATAKVHFEISANGKSKAMGVMDAVPYKEKNYTGDHKGFDQTFSLLQGNVIDLKKLGINDENVLFANPEFQGSNPVGQNFTLEQVAQSHHPKMVPAISYAREHASTLLNPAYILK